MEVVINSCFGGFELSHKAVMRYAEIKGITLYPWIDKISKKVYKERATLNNPEILKHYSTQPVVNGEYEEGTYFAPGDIPRDDPALIQVVKRLGKDANGSCAKLKIVEIPDAVKYEIQEYDGSEWVAEKHRTWE